MRDKVLWCSLFILIFSSLIVASAVMAKPSNKWRLEFSGKAHSDGEIVIELVLIGGQTFTVNIPVKNGTTENNVAKAVTNSLKTQLPKEAFHVERDDGV